VTARYFVVRDMHESIICNQFVCLSEASARVVLRRFAMEKRSGGVSVVYDRRLGTYEYDFRKGAHWGRIEIVEAEGEVAS
jgi:hypothetical protein